MAADGHVLARQSGKNCKDKYVSVPCTRWEELRATVNFHAQLADLLHAPTVFRMLNPGRGCPKTITVGGAPRGRTLQVQAAMESEPGGKTPLCRRLKECRRDICNRTPALRAAGTKAVVVIATDGKPTDGDLGKVLKTFEGLPVWVVIRLCTDNKSVVDYWNSVDADVEVDMDVLDDLEGEAKEVCGPNPWLNYAQPLHRAREWGLHRRVFDLLDEKALTGREMTDFVQLLFDTDGALPQLRNGPSDWPAFETEVRRYLAREAEQADPYRGFQLRPWVNLNRLKKKYSATAAGCCVVS